MLSALEKDSLLVSRFKGKEIIVSLDQAKVLRRIELTLHRWCEAECGDAYGNYIGRDEETDKPYRYYPCGPNGLMKGYIIPDREKGTLRRLGVLCQKLGLYWYYQTDPRGCALYVSKEPLTDTNYSSRGVACCVH